MKFYTPILICVLFLNIVFGARIEREVQNADELDRETIQKTGCKFISLAKGEKKVFSANDPTLNNIVLTQFWHDRNHTKFELHFAIRSDADVKVTLSRKNDKGNTVTAWELTYGRDQVFSIVAYRRRNLKTRVFAQDLLAADKYTNLRIDLLAADHYTIQHNDLDRLAFHGKECNPFPFFSDYEDNIFKDITQFEFEASENGAKILYDCPVDFAKCKCQRTNETPKAG